MAHRQSRLQAPCPRALISGGQSQGQSRGSRGRNPSHVKSAGPWAGVVGTSVSEAWGQVPGGAGLALTA